VRRLGAPVPSGGPSPPNLSPGVSDDISARWILLVLPLIALSTSLATLMALRWILPW
jgi:hypothetical protein